MAAYGLPAGVLKRSHRAKFYWTRSDPIVIRNICQARAVKYALNLAWKDAFALLSRLGWSSKHAPNRYNVLLEMHGWRFFQVPKRDKWQAQNVRAKLAVLECEDGYMGDVVWMKDGKLYDWMHSGAFDLTGIWLPGD